MCLAVFSWQPGADSVLQLVANRDEFRERPTSAMHWWPDNTILAGKDEVAGGSWLGANKLGHFALLTNIRPGFIGYQATRSRGDLVRNFLSYQLNNTQLNNTQLNSPQLSRTQTIEQYHQSVITEIEAYGGFNLLLGDGERLFWFSSTNPQGRWLEAGIYGLSNDSLNTPWPKTELAKQQMQAFLESGKTTLQQSEILTSTNVFADHQLPKTGVPIEWERKVSAQTITDEQYGTRCRTYLDWRNARFNITEQQIDSQANISAEASYLIEV